MRPFPARAAHLEIIAREWRLVDAPRVLVLEGETRAGKSRLIAEALPLLNPDPHSVILGHAGSFAPSPYDWLATALARRPTADLPASHSALAWLTQDPHAPPQRLEPTTLLKVAVSIVRHVAGQGPSVAVVEDVHALDPASLALVAELARADLPLLILVASRRADAGGFGKAAAQLLKTLDETDRCQRLAVEALPPEEIPEPEAAWARYAHALGHETEAAPAALRGAARLLARGDAEGARGLIEHCLGHQDDTELDSVRLALARSLLHLGRLEQATEVARRADSPRLSAAQRTVAELTARERQVLSCLAGGMSNRQVAKSLGISVRTVTVHVSNLLRKTATGSRTEAALWAVEHGLSRDDTNRLGDQGRP